MRDGHPDAARAFRTGLEGGPTVTDSEGSVVGSLSITVAEAGGSERRRRALVDRAVCSAQVTPACAKRAFFMRGGRF